MKKVLTVLAVVAMTALSASAWAGCGSNIPRNGSTNPSGPTGNGGAAGNTQLPPSSGGTTNAGFNHSHH